MAVRKSKKRTHVQISEEDMDKIPKSMIFKMGSKKVGSVAASPASQHALTQLVRDTRCAMEPHTAGKLRERKGNKLRDFVTMAGPLGVSHLMVFTKGESGMTSLRMARVPRGPTLHFKVSQYSLIKDVRKFVRSPKSNDGKLYKQPPLLVMNNFSLKSEDATNPHETLVTQMFQNMFPPLSAQDTRIPSIRRVVMLNKDKETGSIEFRHYAIDTRPVDVTRGVKKLTKLKYKLRKKVPNLSKKQDMADYLLDPDAGAFTSDSDMSEVEEDAIVDLNPDDDDEMPLEEGPSKRAVKLVEIGPRMTLDLIKIEDGVCSGKVLHHTRIKKSAAEIKKLEKRHSTAAKIKADRKAEQEANVQAKTEKKGRMARGKEKAKLKGEDGEDEDEGDDEVEEDEEADEADEEDEDDE